MRIKALKDIGKLVNKNILISFVIVLISLIIFLNMAYIGYRNDKKQIISQSINAAFSLFASELSEKLSVVASSGIFFNYLHSGKLSREFLLPQLLAQIYTLNLKSIVGMEIINDRGEGVFFDGEKTANEVTLDLCYLNRRYLNFNAGNCTYGWRLYFDKTRIVEALQIINPELKICNDCKGEVLLKDKYFGNFPVSHYSTLSVNLTIKNENIKIFLLINIFIISALLTLTIWNIRRVKYIFEKHLSAPIKNITLRIREGRVLPRTDIEELLYLTEQIERWKNQAVELEKIKLSEKAREEKLKMMQAVGVSIAHELRTPLRSIISGASGIKKFLPILLYNYNLAKEANLPVKDIKPIKIKLLNNALSNLKFEGFSANIIIDMFLMKIRKPGKEVTVIKKLSIAECIDETLKRYPFQKIGKKAVVWDKGNDFYFKGDKLLVVHILFNLLKNSLYYIARAQEGRICIYQRKEKYENMMCFRDTGKGISKEILPHVFDRFYSKTEGGIGIGLSFCKMAMEWMGGRITCESIENDFTEFVLHFPILKG